MKEIGTRTMSRPTVFKPESLSQMDICKTVIGQATTRNRIITKDLFDEIIFFKEVKGFVHAIGLAGKTPTILIMKKPNQKKQMNYTVVNSQKEMEQMKLFLIDNNQDFHFSERSLRFPKFVTVNKDGLWHVSYTFNQSSKEMSKEQLLKSIGDDNSN